MNLKGNLWENAANATKTASDPNLEPGSWGVWHRTGPNFRTQIDMWFVTEKLGATRPEIPAPNLDHLQFLLHLPCFLRDSPLEWNFQIEFTVFVAAFKASILKLLTTHGLMLTTSLTCIGQGTSGTQPCPSSPAHMGRVCSYCTFVTSGSFAGLGSSQFSGLFFSFLIGISKKRALVNDHRVDKKIRLCRNILLIQLMPKPVCFVLSVSRGFFTARLHE